jgi:hypothetical protein
MPECIVCGSKYIEFESCRCDPKKYDAAMATDDPLAVQEIDSSKTVSDKIRDGFMILNLLETDYDPSDD